MKALELISAVKITGKRQKCSVFKMFFRADSNSEEVITLKSPNSAPGTHLGLRTGAV